MSPHYFRGDKTTSLLKYCITLQLFLIKEFCALSKEHAMVELVPLQEVISNPQSLREHCRLYPHWNLEREDAPRSPGWSGTNAMDPQAVKSIRKIPCAVPQTGTSSQILSSQKHQEKSPSSTLPLPETTISETSITLWFLLSLSANRALLRAQSRFGSEAERPRAVPDPREEEKIWCRKGMCTCQAQHAGL